MDATLAALADPTRRKVIELLRERPRPAGELAQAVRMSAPALSRHLRVLRASGLVHAESGDADARVRLYTLRREPFTDLQSWLDQVQAFWAEQLGSFRDHVERVASSAEHSSTEYLPGGHSSGGRSSGGSGGRSSGEPAGRLDPAGDDTEDGVEGDAEDGVKDRAEGGAGGGR
ncbi:metalloregulator ArsR/SmtB family transcription factor [Streptosporangium sp. NPDC048047]|uniref:ArsR/SmtB family transcription factor n=1 Tax=Streptosporangium sp. NPDC048047 TaxID=3155748 RepID=UPI003434334E